MNGQWIGRYEGSRRGEIIVNVDERQSCFQGGAVVIGDDQAAPTAIGFFNTTTKARKFRCQAAILPVNPQTRNVTTWEAVRHFYPAGTVMSQHADVRGAWTRDNLKISWTTDIGLVGRATLPRSKATAPSELVPVEKNWSAFKEYVADLESGRFLFRGQSDPWRLRTSFHRAGRADVLRFVREDVQSLHRNLSARTKHVFNLDNPKEYGAFLNLIQHHGYPTPLLDWTYSPYVAAFFAYRGIPNAVADKAPPTKKVRILVLDQRQWQSDLLQIPFLEPATLHFSIQEFLAIENERMIPQQAASTVTNVDDIEAYIISKHSEEKTYLSAIDLPLRDRRRAIQELSYMGMSAGSLFPGLDEACEDLRQRNFEL
jgi:FRG domain